jgi:hypothetical protein
VKALVAHSRTGLCEWMVQVEFTEKRVPWASLPPEADFTRLSGMGEAVSQFILGWGRRGEAHMLVNAGVRTKCT